MSSRLPWKQRSSINEEDFGTMTPMEAPPVKKKERPGPGPRRLTRNPAAETVTRISSGSFTYQIGQEIGRGGFGTVFQALNVDTGDFVALKRVSLLNLDQDSLASIKGEIDLLKKLNHGNIVQYIDTIQTESHLHIVLEVMESSLSAMCKKYGNFSESLTAIYMTQVLEGLKYLHEQGVLHRDIKGANILTTKNGLVKLADFGVAMKLSDGKGDDMDVVGTPYWMAPEIIEMTGVTTACDIWGLGCTIIELLTGKPPYFDLPQMTALYKIVQDDHPPLPDGISPALNDFLFQCFKKEPQLRKGAAELLSHVWLKNPKNHLKKVGNDEALKLSVHGLSPRGTGGEEDRQAVLKTVRTYAQLMQEQSPQRRYQLSESDVRDMTSMADQICEDSVYVPKDSLSTRVGSPPDLLRMPLPPPPPPRTPGGTRGSKVRFQEAEAEEDWDKDMGMLETTPALKLGGHTPRSASRSGSLGQPPDEIMAQLRAMVGKSGGQQEQPGHSRRPTMQLHMLDADALDDWGDEGGDKPDEPAPINAAGTGEGDMVGGGRRILRKFVEDQEGFDDIELPPEGGAGGLSFFKREEPLADKLKLKMAAVQGATTGDDDFEDPFGKNFEAELGLEGDSEQERDTHAKAGQDVFSELSRLAGTAQPAPETVIEACNKVKALLEGTPQARLYILSADHGVAPLIQLTDMQHRGALQHIMVVINKIVEDNPLALEHLCLVGIVPKVIQMASCENAAEAANPEMHPLRVEAAKFIKTICSSGDFTLQVFVSCGGLAVTVELISMCRHLDSDASEVRRVVRTGVDCVLQIFSLQRVRRNDFCRLYLKLGLLTHVMSYISRLLTKAIARPGSPVSPQRLKSLAASSSSGLFESSAGGGPAGSRQSRRGLGTASQTELYWPYLERALQILTTFSKSDQAVKEGMATQEVMAGIMQALSDIYPAQMVWPKFARTAVTFLTVVKNISMEPRTLDSLEAAQAIPMLVPMLERTGSECDQDIENQVVQCMFYMCRLTRYSRTRQEKAALAGLVPYLHRCIAEDSRLKQFALQTMCDLAHTSGPVRDILWQQQGLQFYMGIISNDVDKRWHVTAFRSVAAWLLADTERLEPLLVEPENLNNIITLFSNSQGAEFEKLVDELHAIMQKSPVVVKALGQSAPFIEEVKERLHYPKASVGKTLLTMLRIIHKHHPNPRALIREFDLYPNVSKLAKNNTQVLVAEIATQLLQDFDEHGKYGI